MSFRNGFDKEAGLKAVGIASLMGMAAALGAHADNGPTPELKALIEQKAKAHGVKPEVLEGLVFAESSFRPSKINREGVKNPTQHSLGLAQVQPRTARWLGYKGSHKELMKPENNLEYASLYLEKQLKRYHGDYRKALSAYNAGHAIRANRSYVQKILKYKR